MSATKPLSTKYGISKQMTIDRYYFVASRSHPDIDSAILHVERNCHHIDSVSEDRLAIVCANGAKLRESGLYVRCVHCTDDDDDISS